MGLFDSLRGKSVQVQLDVQKAVMTVLVSAVKADGRIEDEEVAQIRAICLCSPLYSRNSQEKDTANIAFADQFTDDEGIEGAVRKAAEALSPSLRETAFCFATQISLADGYLGEHEKSFLSGLVNWLNLKESRAQQIVEVLAIMNHDANA